MLVLGASLVDSLIIIAQRFLFVKRFFKSFFDFFEFLFHHRTLENVGHSTERPTSILLFLGFVKGVKRVSTF